MSYLFGRTWRIVAGTLDVSKLRCVFDVKKSTSSKPNSAKVEIYGLSETSQKTLSGLGKQVPIKIEAGYEETGNAQLFLGYTRAVSHAFKPREGSVSTLETGDGDSAYSKQVQITISPGQPASVILNSIIGAMGVNLGASPEVLPLIEATAQQLYGVNGGVLSGNATKILTNLCKSCGLEWSIQDGAVQLLVRKLPKSGKAISLSSESGLIGSPSVDSKGVLKAECLLIPGLEPGGLVVMDSRFVKGGYRIEAIDYTGDTHGNPWTAKLTCKKY